jgi:hypothetical protein
MPLLSHRHYIYITEFIWQKLDTGEESKLLSIMDLRGVAMSQIAGEVREFMTKSAKLIGAHYPERSLKIFILNAPWWFNMIWKVSYLVRSIHAQSTDYAFVRTVARVRHVYSTLFIPLL